ncbi:MAG: M48 family metallopeptidase [Opitutales bacterium]|nr:M48 family metallopeptidase [Opitutales bacterium]
MSLDPPLEGDQWVLRLGDGAVCECPAEVYDWICRYKPAGYGGRFTRWAESSMKIAVMCFAATAVALVLFFRVGIPLIADHSARVLPPEIERVVGQQVMDTLDRHLFHPSELPEEVREGIELEFAELVAKVPQSPDYRIEFRRSRIGPNAFALPGGIIIMTDELVDFSTERNQIHAVLAHELGHVEHKHGMRMAFQKAGYALTITFFLGDVSSVLSMGAALPAVLVETGYSRQFEREADLYAAYFLTESGIGVEPMIELLQQITGEYEDASQTLRWLSTHPPTSERARLMREFAASRIAEDEPPVLNP